MARLNCAKLLEVMIERESLSNSELLDDNLARAVCEAPVFVGETFKCLLGAGDENQPFGSVPL